MKVAQLLHTCTLPLFKLVGLFVQRLSCEVFVNLRVIILNLTSCCYFMTVSALIMLGHVTSALRGADNSVDVKYEQNLRGRNDVKRQTC